VSGPAPKAAHLRQRTNKKAGNATLSMVPDRPSKAPPIPNPDAREFHPQTLVDWAHALASPMASQWLQTDLDALGRLALLWDDFYRRPSADALKEIRLQGQLFGLSPLDRSRLQWEVSRADEAEQKKQRHSTPRKTGTHDPRSVLKAIT